MHERRNRTSGFRCSSDVWLRPHSAANRRTLLAGMAALAGAATLAGPVRADDLSSEMILNDPQAPVSGNPAGDLTIVSFFDYNCPFCKRTVEPLNKVLAADGNIRHVYKDWPILALSSVYGARLALAAQYQNRYEEAYLALMGVEESGASEEQMRRALTSAGFDMAALETEADQHDGEITALLQRNNAQAEGLGLRGTPVFLVGQYLVASALDEDGFREVIADAREAA